MERRQLGLGFCCISAFLFSTKYICAAIFGSNVTSWSEGLFNAMLDSVGDLPIKLSIIALVIGIIFIILGEIESIIKALRKAQ